MSGNQVTAANAGSQATIVDCAGTTLMPGLIDMRVFTGEPGNEHRETLATASHAAAAGGVTTMIVMPNTDPVIDDAAIVDFILRRARDTAIVRVAPMAAITKGLKGQLITEFGLLQEAGAVAVTDGNRAVANAGIMSRALAYAHDFGMLVVQHVEEPTLATGVMNASEVATRLGLARHPCRCRGDHARARLKARRAHRRALSRCPDFLPRVPRRDPPSQGYGPARLMWRFGQSSRPQR